MRSFGTESGRVDRIGRPSGQRGVGGSAAGLRVEKGLPLTAMAKDAGLSWQGVGKIEEDECRPRLDSVLKICDALGVPFVAVALLVELHLAGVVVPLARVLRRLRGVRRIFRRFTDFGPSA